MLIEPEIETVFVVLLGRLNPVIFQPQWFARHGLITDELADEAHVEIIHPEISKFHLGDRYTFSIESSRLIAEVRSPPFIDVSDLLERTFREFLAQTPIFRMGINRAVHFSVGSEEARNDIGKRLAPPDPWGDWGINLEGDPSLLKRGGLRSLTVEQRGLNDRPKGHIQAKIEPSLKIEDNAGIYMSINDDFSVEDPDKIIGCNEIMDLLHDNFDASMRRAEGIINHIMSLKS